jgi:Ala-tRNA(Pro) deacylase
MFGTSASTKLGNPVKLVAKYRPEHASIVETADAGRSVVQVNIHGFCWMRERQTAMRVSEFLSDRRIVFEEMMHPPAFTSQKLAKFLHISGRHVVKSILLKGPQGFFLAVLPAAQRIDLAGLGIHFGGPVRLANVQELCELFRDCEWGASIPFGRLYGLATILETSLASDAMIVFEAQRHALAIRMLCRDFVLLENPERLTFARDEIQPHPQPQAG